MLRCKIDNRVKMNQLSEGGSTSNKAADVAPLIALRGISRIHDGGAIAALRNVDLQIEAGDRVAIVGASGSGKSSLVNLLCGIDYPSEGTVLWEGEPVRTQRAWTRLRRNGIGIVFQEFNLVPTLTVLENVELAGAAYPRRNVKPLPPQCLNASGYSSACTIRSPNYRAASVSGWLSRARLSTSRSCCSPMNRPAISTASALRMSPI
jgi:ABC-type branched-subunit amino acid transport system ATPase component